MGRNVWLLVRVLVITKLDVELSSRERERERCICAYIYVWRLVCALVKSNLEVVLSSRERDGETFNACPSSDAMCGCFCARSSTVN